MDWSNRIGGPAGPPDGHRRRPASPAGGRRWGGVDPQGLGRRAAAENPETGPAVSGGRDGAGRGARPAGVRRRAGGGRSR